ncbi:MAG: hypothetical protein H6850_01415 [Alphaproteobacteria bacterium]|nr:MAG: hypothetical protein H6850_01415 [Alphaproteobacteria bacterium]
MLFATQQPPQDKVVQHMATLSRRINFHQGVFTSQNLDGTSSGCQKSINRLVDALNKSRHQDAWSLYFQAPLSLEASEVFLYDDKNIGKDLLVALTYISQQSLTP